MEIKYILFIVVSAFFHAFYNYLMRRSGGSRTFLLWMFTAASLIATVVTAVRGDYRDIPWAYVPYILGASSFYILYQVFVAKSYEQGNISANYPLTVLSPIFIPFWAFLFLGERISFLTGMGIMVTVAGAVLVKLNAFNRAELKKMFTFNRDYVGARFALGASFVYSFGAVFDKSKIAHFSLSIYLFFLLYFMTLQLLVYHSVIRRKPFLSYIKSHWKPVLIGGIVVNLSFYTFRIALKVVPVSITVPVRQVAVVFAILLGVFSLKEKISPGKLLGSAVIIAGIILVNMGY